ncbi:MAG: Trk system potassium transporter TrkA [Lentisphaeria bacterium]|nr:Trk system potassium transporter TrkA [Lentisphaeria bacterium]
MKIVIAGAGELGQLLSEELSANGHSVVLIDSSADPLDRISGSLDIRLLEGNCIDHTVLREAGTDQADLFLAVCGEDATNILSCQLSSRLGCTNTLCRISEPALFSRVEESLTPESFGIWKYVSPPEECVRKIVSILDHCHLLEEIRFSHPDALMRFVELTPSSPLCGIRVKDIPRDLDILSRVRFAALVRGRQLIIPHGDTLLVPGDKIYIAGKADHVRDFTTWLLPEESPKGKRRVVISGGTVTALALARKLHELDYEVRILERNSAAAERIPDQVPPEILVLHGNATEEEVLREAGIDHCHAFISAASNDEDNILSCIIAKRMGAEKTVSVTSKPEYIRIVPTMDMIDCPVSSTLVAVNSVLRVLGGGTMRVDANLQMYRSALMEFKVHNSSPLCGKSLAVCKLPPSSLFALLFRNGEVIAPSGNTVFRPGDTVVAIVPKESEKEYQILFPEER